MISYINNKSCKGSKIAIAFVVFLALLFVAPFVMAHSSAGTLADVAQSNYCWRNDDGSETTATWKANNNTAINAAPDAKLRIRLDIQMITNNMILAVTPRLQFSSDAGGDCTAGTWTDIGLQAGGEVWRLVASSNFADGDPTTQQISSVAFIGGRIYESSQAQHAVSLDSGNDLDITEFEWSIEGNSPSLTTYYFRTIDNSGTVYGSGYANCAAVTVVVDNPPTWSNPSVDNPTPNPGVVVSHNVSWQDDNGLSYATLEVNSSGVDCDTTANVTNTTLSGQNKWANLTWTVPNACEGKTIGWRQYANDSLNQWNSSMPLQTYTVENINPTATFGTDPINNYNSTSQLITFNLSCSDNLGVSTLQLWGNWTGIWHANQTNSSPVNGTVWSIQVDGIPEGKGHVWGVWCNDSLNNEDWTNTNRTFTVDSIGPTINTEGANETNISQNEYFCLNITATDSVSGVDTVYAEVWNTTHLVNYTMNDTGTSCGGIDSDNVYGVEIHGTTQGIWNYSKVWANDTLNNWNSSDFTDLTINVTAPSDTHYPQFTNPQENPINDSNYLFGQAYQFNSTVTHTNGTIFLSFGGTNYSASNDTATNFYVDITSLSADTYNYYWWGYGNGSQNMYNSSDTRAYVVQKINPNASLENNESWTVTYPTTVKINYSESNDGDGGVVYTVYRNGVNKGSEETITLGFGTYDYVLNTTGGTNYTANSSIDAETLIVNKNTGACGVLFNETPLITYPTTFKVWTNCTSDFVLYRNETPIENNSPQNLAADTYNFTVIRNDTVNYSNYYDEKEFIVEQATGEVYAWINNQMENRSALLYNEEWLNATLNAGDPNENCSLYYNNTLIEQGVCPLANLTNFTQIGEFNVTAFYDGNENWTNDYQTWWVNVSEDSPPTINIIYPENIIYKVNVSVLNYTVEDDIDLSHCWYSLNEGETNSSPDTDCANHTGLTSSEGPNTWTVWVNDSIGQESSDSVTFTKDTTYPQVSIIYPENNTDYTVNVTDLNYTFTETNPDKCWRSNSSGAWNSSPQNCGTNWTDLISNEDSNTWTVYMNDTAGNENSSSVTFTKDTAYPVVTINSPLNETYNTNSTLFNVTATDGSDVDSCWYSLTGGSVNYSMTETNPPEWDNTNSSMTQGLHTVNFYCNDSYNNLNDTEQETFFIDSIYPQFSNYKRNPTTPNEDEHVQVNVTITETNLDKVILEWDATTNYTVTTSNENEYYFTVLSGNYTAHESVTYYWYANDTAGNINKSSEQDFTVANRIPSVSAPEVNDTTPETNDILNCTGGDFSDDDGDSEQARYFKWYDTDVEISGQTSQTLDLNISGLDKGEVIKCSVRVYDGYDNSTWVNSSNTAEIQNSPPTITNPLTTVSWDTNGSTYNYDYEATDPDTGDSLTWYVNTTLFDINSATGEISNTPIESEAGTYSIRINVSDGTVNATNDFTYIINDTIYPSINFQPPTEEDESQLTRNYIQVNVTASDGKAIDTINITLYNSTSLVQSNTSSTSPLFVNFTNLPDENYYFNATVNDTSGNLNQTDTKTVSTDTGPPTISYVSPTEDSGVYKSQNYVEVNVTAGDPNLDKIVIRLYNSAHTQIDSATTSSSPNFANFTGLSNGLYYYNATANDTFGNDESLATKNITLDTIVPLIDFTTGTEDPDTTHSRNWIFVNVTVIEDNQDTITFSLYNQTALVNETPYANQQRTINWTGLPNAIYYYNVSINDTAGNSNSTETRTIILDTEGPKVSLLTESPNDPANYSEGGIYMFNATVTDPSLDVVWVDFNGTNYIATEIAENIYNITLSDLSVGNYSYRWYANDSFSNLNDSENGTYTINQGVPNLTLTITPSTSEEYGTQTNATGSGCPEQLNCKLYRDGIDVTGENGQNITLGVEVYNYTYNVTGNTNYTSASVSDNLTINQAIGVVFTYLNNEKDNITIEQDTEIYLNGTLETGQEEENITLYYNNTLIEQGLPPLSNLTNFTTIGLFNITTTYDGNENYTSAYETWWVNVTEADETPPQISIIYPENISYNSVQTQLNYTVWDNFGLNYCECWYSINNGQTNETIDCGTNKTGLNSGQGSSTWTVWANDSKNNLNSSSVTFFVDSINPTIQFVDFTETSGTSLGRNYIQVNVTASDDNLDTITIRLYNSTNLLQTNISNLSSFFRNYTGLSAGTYYFNATANDTLNNQNSTEETKNVTLVLPSLIIHKPENETYLTNKNLLLNYSAEYEDTVEYNIDLTGNNIPITGNTTFNTSEGQHILYLYANNSIGTTTKNVTFTVNLTKFIILYSEYNGSKKGESTNFHKHSYKKLQNLSEVVLENTDYGKIEFNEAINLTDDANVSDNEADLDANINISENRIEIDSTALPNFNKSATLYFYGLSSVSKKALRNEEECSPEICKTPIYSAGTWSFNVTGFTVYSLKDDVTPAVVTPTPRAPSAEGSVGVECLDNSDCEGDEICWNYRCVKLFDIKIIDFESPAKLGDFFDFTYFIKGMADINDDVEVRFWIEKDGEKVTSGSDTIYLGSFEEKTETTKIFLPTSTKSGVYTFYIQVVHQAYEAKSHRTIEIEVEGGVAVIKFREFQALKIYVLIIIALLSIIIIFLIINRLKRRQSRIQERIKQVPKEQPIQKRILQPAKYTYIQRKQRGKEILKKILKIFRNLIGILFLSLSNLYQNLKRRREEMILQEQRQSYQEKPKEKKQILMPRRYSLKDVLKKIEIAYLRIRHKLKLTFERMKEKIKKEKSAEQLVKEVKEEIKKKPIPPHIKPVKVKEIKIIKEPQVKPSTQTKIKIIKPESPLIKKPKQTFKPVERKEKVLEKPIEIIKKKKEIKTFDKKPEEIKKKFPEKQVEPKKIQTNQEIIEELIKKSKEKPPKKVKRIAKEPQKRPESDEQTIEEMFNKNKEKSEKNQNLSKQPQEKTKEELDEILDKIEKQKRKNN